MGKILIIAEAGVNHNGSIELAKKLIDSAANAGADAVKFQTFKAENLVTKNAEKASYQKETTDGFESQFDMIRKLELNEKSHRVLMDYCRSKNILFCSTPFDLESIEMLKEMKVPFWKIPSGEITNLPYLKKIGGFNEKVILSTGMSTMVEIEEALQVLMDAGTLREKISLLHCNTEYPTPFTDVNLNAMETMRQYFRVEVGYSDHTLGIEVTIAAAALGATIIEKHITLDCSMEGPDHRASLEPDQLIKMIKSLRNIELSLGSSKKNPTLSELRNKTVVRKSIVANENIKKGEIFSEDNLTIKRPGTGLSPMRWDEIIGKVAERDYQRDEVI